MTKPDLAFEVGMDLLTSGRRAAIAEYAIKHIGDDDDLYEGDDDEDFEDDDYDGD